MPDRPLTTGDVAKNCHVTVNAVKNWIKSGMLKAYRTPGGHYRIWKRDFMTFLNTHSLPLKKEPVASLHQSDKIKSTKKTKNKNLPDKRFETKILVVDDEPTVVDFIIEALKDTNSSFIFEKAMNGYEALLKVGDFKPDILILDLMMPKIDGFEVCKQIKGNPATGGIKILAITAYGSRKNIDNITKYGANSCLLKPFQIEELKEKVFMLLGKPPLK